MRCVPDRVDVATRRPAIRRAGAAPHVGWTARADVRAGEVVALVGREDEQRVRGCDAVVGQSLEERRERRVVVRQRSARSRGRPGPARLRWPAGFVQPVCAARPDLLLVHVRDVGVDDRDAASSMSAM